MLPSAKAVRFGPGMTAYRSERRAVPEALSESAALLPRAGRPAPAPALLPQAEYPRRTPPAGLPLARLERVWRLTTATAWRPRAATPAARPSGAQQAQRSARPAASAAPVTVRPREAVAVQSAQQAAAVRQPEAAAELRAPAAAEVGAVPLGEAAVVRQPEAAAVAVPLGEAAAVQQPGVAAEEVVRPGAAVRPRAAPPDVGLRRAVRASAFHPDQVHPWPAPPPSGRFARARKVRRVALP